MVPNSSVELKATRFSPAQNLGKTSRMTRNTLGTQTGIEHPEVLL